jgi:prophage maintenance system killer protein
MNGWRLTMTNDQAYDFILDIAAGNNREIEYVASYLQEFSEPRRQG